MFVGVCICLYFCNSRKSYGKKWVKWGQGHLIKGAVDLLKFGTTDLTGVNGKNLFEMWVQQEMGRLV